MSTAALIELPLDGSVVARPFSPQEFGVALDELRADVLAGPWQSVLRSGAKCSALAIGSLAAIYGNGEPLPPLGAVISRGVLGAMLGAAAASPERAVLFQAIRDALAQRGEPPTADLLDRLTALEHGDLDPFAAVMAPVAPSDTTFELALAALVRGLLASAHGTFNTIYEAEAANPIVGSNDDTVESAVTAAIDRFEADLDAAIAACQQSCRDDAASPGIVADAQALCHFAQSRIPRLGRVLARGRRAYERRLAAGQGIAAERLGNTLVRGGTRLRETIAGAVAAQRLALGSVLVDRSSDVAEVRAQAADLGFTGALPNGLNRQIHQLSSDLDGAFLEIHGRVVATSAAVDSSDRLVGRIELSDPSSGATVQAVGLFINPGNVGITVDAHLRLSGVFRSSSILNEGDAAILIDRFSLAEIAVTGWRMAFLRLGFDWFPVFRNAHNLFWAIGPHTIGPTLIPSHAGAAELLFLGYGPAAAEPQEPA